MLARAAVALYNTYAFGYALGMDFRNTQGRREMLWPQVLDDIAINGPTAHDCRIAGTEKENSHVISYVP